jgi:gliding motility-associated-like protein
MKNNITLLILLIFNILAYSQKQNNNWYFGDHAGLDFSSGSPVAVINGQINTAEGCSTISNNSGNLLFYTDGQTVYNKNHIVMPNGTGLLGHPSTTQSALITPVPGNASKYYIFTIDDLGDAMTYSIVDMALQSGNGDVTATKNVMLHPAVSEKQCAVQRCDGNIWVLSHQSTTNTFYADLLTPSGISSSVLSSVGTSHSGGGGGGTFNTVGQMKFSQQGNRLALAIRDAALFEVFDFNINTGTISNPKAINPGSYPVAYGVEFSPDGTKLYGGIITGSSVYQFNLLAGSATAISASATLIGSSSGFTNSLQLGTDGKIYVAKSVSQTVGIGFLDVINNPNLSGSSCSYVTSGLSLSGKSSFLGLPNLMVYPSSSQPLTITGTTTICSGQSTTLTATGAITYQWSGGTTASGSSINASPLVSTKYYVTGTSACGSVTDSIVVQVNPSPNVSISGPTNVCSGDSITLNANGATSYQWSGGTSSTSSSLIVSPLSTTTYYVIGIAGSCSGKDTIIVNITPVIPAQFTYQSSGCGEVSFVNLASGGSAFYWNFGDGNFSNDLSPRHTYGSGIYNVLMVVNANTNCADSIQQTIMVTADTPGKCIVPNVFTPNGDGIDDEFKISGLSICDEYRLEIYNRWGQKVFETTDPRSVSWNGLNGEKKKIIEGTYFYILISSKNPENKLKGALTLFR